MAFYTLIGKSITCPQYHKKISISGKYYFTENPDNEYEVRFSHAICPIVENSKLNKEDQKEEYKYLQCFQPDEHCEFLDDFPRIFDARNSLK